MKLLASLHCKLLSYRYLTHDIILTILTCYITSSFTRQLTLCTSLLVQRIMGLLTSTVIPLSSNGFVVYVGSHTRTMSNTSCLFSSCEIQHRTITSTHNISPLITNHSCLVFNAQRRLHHLHSELVKHY